MHPNRDAKAPDEDYFAAAKGVIAMARFAGARGWVPATTGGGPP